MITQEEKNCQKEKCSVGNQASSQPSQECASECDDIVVLHRPIIILHFSHLFLFGVFYFGVLFLAGVSMSNRVDT